MQQASIPQEHKLHIRIGRSTLIFQSTENGIANTPPHVVELRGGVSASANLRTAFKQPPLDGVHFDRCTVLVDSPTMLVPDDDFRPEDAAILFDHCFTGHERDHKCHAAREALHAVALFALDKDLETVVADHASTSLFLPVCLPIWEHFGRQTSSPRQRLHGYFHDGKVDIFCIAGNRFKFCNAFSATHSHDTLYFLLSVFSQLGMKATRDEVVLLGATPHQQWITDNLEKYVERVTVTPTTDETLPLDLSLLLNIPRS